MPQKNRFSSGPCSTVVGSLFSNSAPRGLFAHGRSHSRRAAHVPQSAESCGQTTLAGSPRKLQSLPQYCGPPQKFRYYLTNKLSHFSLPDKPAVAFLKCFAFDIFMLYFQSYGLRVTDRLCGLVGLWSHAYKAMWECFCAPLYLSPPIQIIGTQKIEFATFSHLSLLKKSD